MTTTLDPLTNPSNITDPGASFLSSSCLDFLLIELVPLAQRVASDRDALPALTGSGGKAGGGVASPGSTSAAKVGGGGLGGGEDGDDDEGSVMYRLDLQGYRVGQGLVERFSRDRPRFNDTLDVIKFLCKDLWSIVFGKNIDNLKTNHRGVFVLTDNVFRPFSRMSTDTGGQAIARAQPFLYFPCGIVRGALAALGIRAEVHAEVTELPGAVFQIKTMPDAS